VVVRRQRVKLFGHHYGDAEDSGRLGSEPVSLGVCRLPKPNFCVLIYSSCNLTVTQSKVNSKVHSRTDREGPEGE